MGRKSISGLYQRNGIWHINKRVKGYGRIYESTGTGSREEAEQYLIHKLEKIRQAIIYGVRPQYTFRQAAAKYLVDNQQMASIDLSARYLEAAVEFIGGLSLDEICDETLTAFKAARKRKGNANRTINLALQRVIRVLNLAAKKWRDPITGHFWLDKVPMIETLSDDSEADGETGGKIARAYPLSWDEQRILFKELPRRLEQMALFKVNTGTREQEVCKLRWEWEIPVPQLNTSVFLVPRLFGGRRTNNPNVRKGVKNRQDRLIILNDVAKSIVDEQRGQHNVYVFGVNRQGDPLGRMYNTSWKLARERAAQKYKEEFGSEPHPALKTVRVHDLKHTFGRRLRALGVPFEDRQVLLGHASKSLTTHYSAPELANLIAQANKVAAKDLKSAPALTILRRLVA